MRSPWMIAVGCGLTMAGCKKKEEAPKPATAMVASDAAVGPPDAGAVIDAGPAPLTPAIPAGTIGVQVNDLEYGGFEQPGLPAIRDDGGLVVVTSVGDDGGRGYLDLRMLVLDGATGAVTKTLVLADPDETSDAGQKDEGDPALGAAAKLDETARKRVVEANAVLAAGTWRTMVGAATRATDGDPLADREPQVVGDLSFKLDAAKGVVTIARAGATVATATVAKLMPKATKRGADDEGCGGDAPYLRGVYTDLPSKRALLEIGYLAGGHNCGAGGQGYAVVAIP